MAQPTGHIAQVLGSVVDVAFAEGDLPQIYEAWMCCDQRKAIWYWKCKGTWVKIMCVA